MVTFGIGRAVKEMKNGERVARYGWNGKDMWLSLTVGREIEAKHLWSPHNQLFAEEHGGSLKVDSYVTMKTAQNTVVPWLCSQSDLLAEDWFVVT